jgi:Zn-dependent protease with chaperone function
VLPDLVNPKERTYLAIAMIFSILVYLMLIFSLIGIFYVLVFATILVIGQGIAIGQLRNTSVRVSERQFPALYATALQICPRLGIAQVPPIYITQSGGLLNAFATRFFGRNYVCIYSDVLELAYEQGDQAVAFVLAHELTHVARKHVWWKEVIAPAQFVPFLSSAYARACEYTCDAYGAYLYPQGAEAGLLVLAAGKRLYREMNAEAFMLQAGEPEDLWTWLAEHLSGHPNLCKRLLSVRILLGSRAAQPVAVPVRAG